MIATPSGAVDMPVGHDSECRDIVMTNRLAARRSLFNPRHFRRKRIDGLADPSIRKAPKSITWALLPNPSEFARVDKNAFGFRKPGH